MQMIQTKKSIFSAGKYQYHLVDEVQKPLKDAFEALEKKNIFGVIRNLRRALKGIDEMPEPTKENVREPNSIILIDNSDDLFKHLNFSSRGQHYIRLFKLLIKYVIIKYDYDRFYKSLLDWWFGEMEKKGWSLSGYNRPSTKLWHKIQPDTRKRMADSINLHYDNLQRRNKVIDDTLGDSKEAQIHKVSRREQFVRNILGDIELEVDTWRN